MTWDDKIEEFDRIFDQVRKTYSNEENTKAIVRKPMSFVKEKEKSVIAQIELPGIQKENLDINIRNRGIEIKAKKLVEKRYNGGYHASSLQFCKIVPLPAEVNPEKAVVVLEDGLLKIEIPKRIDPK
ncbi:MAG: Hsp20/alpha crystallin family protein [Nanoarchaeota archaeon]